MANLILIVSLVAMVTKVWCNECVDSRCFPSNSNATGENVVVRHGCMHTGDKMYTCSLSIMVFSDETRNQYGCVPLSKVPGITQFCDSLSIDGLLAAAPPVSPDNKDHDHSYDIATGTPGEEAIDLRNEYITCIETDVLVGVAIGSFVLGCFITWAVITVLAQCKALQKELKDVQNSTSIRSNGRAIINFEMGSTSAHQRLLSTGSVESYPSSIPGSQMRRQSEDTRHDDGGGNGRSFQMRQPLPAPPIHEVTVQPYYAQPIDSLYTCVSDKDYQSIQGGSEHYAPVSEGGDYTSLKSQRVTIVRADNTPRKTEDNTEGNDYSTLESERGGSQDEGATAIYYPVSDASNRDYTELTDDSECDTYNGLDHCDKLVTLNKSAAVRQTGNNDPVKFQVSSFAGFGAPVTKSTKQSTTPKSEPLGSVAKITNELTTQSSGPKVPDTIPRKLDKVYGTAGGYEMVQSNTIPHKKNQHQATNTLNGHLKASASSDNVNINDKPSSVATTSYASIDDHDYDTCNGSIHDYYVLEEPANAS